MVQSEAEPDGEWRVEFDQASDIEFDEEPFVREFDDSAFERIQFPDTCRWRD